MPTTSFTETTETGFDSDVADISRTVLSNTTIVTGADSAPNTAYTFTLANDIPLSTNSPTLTLQSGSSLELDGPGALVVGNNQTFLVKAGTLSVQTAVSGGAFANSAPAAAITLNGAALVIGSSSDAGANEVVTGSVLGQSATDTVDNFGQIKVGAGTGTTTVAAFLSGGGTFTNESTGTVEGQLAGVVFGSSVGTTPTLANAGTIAADNAGYGAYFAGSGGVVNGSGTNTAAVIQGAADGVLIAGTAQVTNDATIASGGVTGSGVLIAGGTVDNGLSSGTAALIQGGEYGVQVSSASAVVTNLGLIETTDASGQPPSAALVVGVSLAAGGTLYNGFTASFVANAAAVTSGADYGVLVQGAAGTVVNSGTISGNVAINFNSVAGLVEDNGAITSTAGALGTAIQFGNGNSTLALGAGFTITGRVEGGGGAGATTTLDLTSGTGNSTNGMITNTGNFSGLAANSGTVTTTSGTTTNTFGFDTIQTIEIDSGATWGFSGANAATNLQLGGEADVAAGGRLEITGTAAGTGTISLGANAGLVIDAAANFGTGQGMGYQGDVIAQFAIGNSIDLKDVNFASLTAPTFTNNQLQLSDGTRTADLNFAPGLTLASFNFTVDSGTGTVITVACYCPGTRIATPLGEVVVEALAIGDLVSTADGRAEAIRWIGRRSYAARFLLANPKVQPVRFRAGSLGDGLPRRDLLVSPEHAMLLDGMLIPARCLVDGVQIVAERGWTAVDYIHIELASHEAILAEGAASETFIDDDSRAMFQNAGEYTELYPDARPAGSFCAPRVEDGYELEAIRQRLAGVAVGFAEAA